MWKRRPSVTYSTILNILGVVTSAGMFIVLVMGALVTNTGSGHGCSNTWPLCNGKVLPGLSLSTGLAEVIEFSHRAVTAVESLFVIIFAVGVFFYYRRVRREALVLPPVMILFLCIQAILGAIAAGVHETPSILALHFGISLISFASIVLTTVFVSGAGGRDLIRDRPSLKSTKFASLFSLVFAYVVIYSGAFVVHVGADAACRSWPTCDGQWAPFGAPYLVLVQMAHRGAAALLIIFLAYNSIIAIRERRVRPDLALADGASIVLVALQAFSGAYMISSGFSLLSRLIHAGLVSLLFAALSVAAYQLLSRRGCIRRYTVIESSYPTAGSGISSVLG